VDLIDTSSDREIEIIQTLLEKVGVFEEAMATTCDYCAELDCLLSFAEASRAYNYVRPDMVEDNVIDIRAGR
jgi:DNA mismatch repair protein MSH5